MKRQETQLSLTNRTARSEIFYSFTFNPFKKYHDLETGVMGH